MNSVTIDIKGPIGFAESAGGEIGVTLNSIKDQIGTQDFDHLIVNINSEGGDVFEGYEIFNYLNELKKSGVKVETRVSSLAASIASLIAIIGDPVVISEVGQIMIHNPTAAIKADSKELTKVGQYLSQIEQTLIAMYKKKTGLAEKEIRQMMEDETFLFAKDAVEKGFADKVDKIEMKAKVLAYADFKHMKTENLNTKDKNILEQFAKKFEEKFDALLDKINPKNMIEVADAEGTAYFLSTDEVATGATVFTDAEMTAIFGPGEIVLDSGQTLVVDEIGVVTEIREGGEDPEAQVKELNEEIQNLRKTNLKLKKENEDNKTAIEALGGFKNELDELKKTLGQEPDGTRSRGGEPTEDRLKPLADYIKEKG